MTLFNTIFGPFIELKSVIFRKISPLGPGSRRKIYFKQKIFLELYPYPYPVQLPNYLEAGPGTGRKTLRYMFYRDHLNSNIIKTKMEYKCVPLINIWPIYTAFLAVSPRHRHRHQTAQTGPNPHRYLPARPIQTGTGPVPTCLNRHQSRVGLCRSISSH